MQGRAIMSTSYTGKAPVISVAISQVLKKNSVQPKNHHHQKKKTNQTPHQKTKSYPGECIWENPWLWYLVVADSLLQLSQLTSQSTRWHQAAGDQAGYSPHCHRRSITGHENIVVCLELTVQSLLSKLIWLELDNSTDDELHQAVFPSNRCPNCDKAGSVSHFKVWVRTEYSPSCEDALNRTYQMFACVVHCSFALPFVFLQKWQLWAV